MFILKWQKTYFQTVLRKCSHQQQRYFSERQHPRRVFSGIQPTGSVHLGNYLGAIRQWVDMQNAGDDVTFCIVDLHSLTFPQEPKKLSHNILEMTATLLACGIDPKRSVLFQQSRLTQHTDLCWHLACISTMARLAHLPQYKEKSEGLKDIPLGIFIYPVLQAADILIHKATHVPVGEDQVQQIQLAQDLARMFNSRYKTKFPIPHSILVDGAARLRSLRDPAKKMSKSDLDPKSRINLTDTPDEIAKKIKKAVTDFNSKITFDMEIRAGVSNLVLINSLLENKSTEDVCREAENLNTLEFKYKVADLLIEYVSPIQRRIADHLANPDYLLDVLEDGAARARVVAEKTMAEVENKVGIRFKRTGISNAVKDCQTI